MNQGGELGSVFLVYFFVFVKGALTLVSGCGGGGCIVCVCL